MADVIRVSSFQSLRFSSSLVLGSFPSTFSGPQLGLPSNQILDKRIYPLAYSSSAGLSRLSFTPRKHSVSLKVSCLSFDQYSALNSMFMFLFVP